MPRFPSLAVLARALADGTTEAASLVETCLTRIANYPQLHAFVTLFAEAARAQAIAADARRRAGTPRSPFDGIPYAAKDLFDVAGQVTGAGSRAGPREPAARSAAAIERLEAAGLILIGKTATVEFGCGGWGTGSATAVPWNPWDLHEHRVPGGSSSGSGVAVAAGLVPVALGTDTGGSVRLPAAFCGCVGLKPSPGRVDRRGIIPYSHSHDSVGFLTASVADAAALLSLLDGTPPPTPPPLAGLRVGVLEDPALEKLDPVVAAAYARAQAILVAQCIVCIPLALPETVATYCDRAGRIALAEAYRAHHHRVEAEPNKLIPSVRDRLLSGKGVSETEHALPVHQRTQDGRLAHTRLKQVDVLLAPIVPAPARLLAGLEDGQSPSRFARFANYLDLPALAVPVGLSLEGLPLAVQILAAPGGDAPVLAVAETLFQALPDPFFFQE
jgi:aspartyl-tRNA(Asn)/glutamyl-tRNA(Gln) amidotransferase subunit A